jgi:PAS domain S-box-containing protein
MNGMEELTPSGGQNSNWVPQFVDSMIEGFQVIDREWKYVYLNQSIVRQSKYNKKEDLLGYTMMEKYPGIENTKMFMMLQKTMYERIPQEIENEFRFPDGSTGWFLLSVQPAEEGIVILSIDITERKRLADNLQKSFDLISTQKKQLEEFCNTVSHNLRGPITNILMLSDYIDSSDNPDELKVLVQKLKQAGSNLNDTFELLVETLQFQRDNNLKIEKIVLDEFFETVKQSMHSEIIRLNADIITDFNEAPHILIPENYAINIFKNLLSNSLRFHHPERPLRIMVKSRRKNGSILLSVSDNGNGLDVEKHRDNLFRMRKTFHRHQSSKGIGLFVTRKQIESLGGKIWAEGIAGEGTTFYIELQNQHL